MTDIIKTWISKAGSDLRHAKASFKIKDYDWAALAAQQAAEKALKALCLQNDLGLIKIHDLATLARKVNAPKSIIEKCGLLNPFYTASRYPDALEFLDEAQNMEAAKDAISASGEILRWCQKKIKT